VRRVCLCMCVCVLYIYVHRMLYMDGPCVFYIITKLRTYVSFFLNLLSDAV